VVSWIAVVFINYATCALAADSQIITLFGNVLQELIVWKGGPLRLLATRGLPVVLIIHWDLSKVNYINLLFGLRFIFVKWQGWIYRWIWTFFNLS
jgi:hypothetical protein